MMLVLQAVLIGAGATLGIDLWGSFLRRAFDVKSLDYCLLGRWVLHMPNGTFVHASIAQATEQRHECAAGWAAHYSIGVGLAVLFVLLAPEGWLLRPTLLPALLFGVVSVAAPFLAVQPGIGLGIAASKAPSPWKARLKSVITHSVYGVGLFASAYLLSRVR